MGRETEIPTNHRLDETETVAALPISPELDFREPPRAAVIDAPDTIQEGECLWEDDPAERQRMIDAFSPAFQGMPQDFEHIDFSEKEQKPNDVCAVLMRGFTTLAQMVPRVWYKNPLKRIAKSASGGISVPGRLWTYGLLLSYSIGLWPTPVLCLVMLVLHQLRPIYA